MFHMTLSVSLYGEGNPQKPKRFLEVTGAAVVEAAGGNIKIFIGTRRHLFHDCSRDGFFLEFFFIFFRFLLEGRGGRHGQFPYSKTNKIKTFHKRVYMMLRIPVLSCSGVPRFHPSLIFFVSPGSVFMVFGLCTVVVVLELAVALAVAVIVVVVAAAESAVVVVPEVAAVLVSPWQYQP